MRNLGACKIVLFALLVSTQVWAVGGVFKSNIVTLSVIAQASPGTLPAGLGWHDLPNTKMRSVCYPSVSGDAIYGTNGCGAVMSAWGSAIADTTRNRMIVWGGGHNDYYGNEIYAFSLGSMKWQRLNEPSLPTADHGNVYGPTALSDGKPNGRHTFDNLVYIKNTDTMYSVGGAPSGGAGGLSSDTWFLNLGSLTWTLKSSSISQAGNGVVAGTDIDPITNIIYLAFLNSYLSYNPSTNLYTELGGGVDDYHFTARVDPIQKKFVVVSGKGFWMADISPTAADKTLKPLSMSGCAGIMVDQAGISFDSKLGKLVGWAGGNTTYTIDIVTKSCTQTTFSGGPGERQPDGTTGRFRYFPDYNVHVLANDVDQDVFILRLSN